MTHITVDDLKESVLALPAAEARALVDDISRELARRERASERSGHGTARGNLAALVGLLDTGGPPPTDEEVAAMLEERRQERFGTYRS